MNPESKTGKPLILVVDDEAYIAELLSEMLTDELDCTVISALNAIKALELARSTSPNLIITDLMMPRMNGEALVRAVRADAQLERTPVIAMSAAQGKPAWVTDAQITFLPKPFEADVLIAVVSQLLDTEQPPPRN